MTEASCRRILLVGFMGSGKSTVGRALAERLDWDFLDFDDVIRQETGASIDTMFRERGEAHFRRLEEEVAGRLLARSHAVLASGGGWAAAPGRMETLARDTLTVWLQVSPKCALRRLEGQPIRPLLAGPDPLSEAERLLSAREPFYGMARLTLNSEDAAPAELAERLVRTMKELAYL